MESRRLLKYSRKVIMVAWTRLMTIEMERNGLIADLLDV